MPELSIEGYNPLGNVADLDITEQWKFINYHIEENNESHSRNALWYLSCGEGIPGKSRNF